MRTVSVRNAAIACAAALALLAAAMGARAYEPAPQVPSPVGGVLAFAGEQPPTGWLVADGRPLRSADYPELYSVIRTTHGTGVDDAGVKVGEFNLPDYRGLFLRGVDLSEQGTVSGQDPDAATRTAPGRGTGNTGNRVGSLQGAATAAPSTPFTVTEGAHQHRQSMVDGSTCCRVTIKAAGNGSASPIDSNIDTQLGGAHSHSIAGGDRETRPRNAAVLWIIRAK